MTDVLDVFAEVELPDPASYFGGFKDSRVLDWDPIQRGLSDHTGQMQNLSFGATLRDTDRYFRGLLDDPNKRFFSNRPSTIRIIDHSSRRLQQDPYVIANGFIGDHTPDDNLRFKVMCHDWIKRRFTRAAEANENWQPRITPQDFPRANGSIITADGAKDYFNMGKIIPIIYGRITDTKLAGSFPYNDSHDPLTDDGDGQFVPIYVGDYQLNGETWRGALVCAHQCYIEAGFLFHDPVDLRYDQDWLTSRRLDGAWTDAGFSNQNNVITINGHDYGLFFIKGYAGDVFAGVEPIPEIRQGKFGNVPIAINVWGRTDTSSEEGILLTDGFDQFLDFLMNYVSAEPQWVTGLPIEIPMFPTFEDKQIIDTASFETCKQIAQLRVGGGYELNFVIGANNQKESILDIIAQFNVNLDCEHYWNRFGQFTITMEPEDDSDALGALTDILDINDGSFKVTDNVASKFWNVLPFRHTPDYTGRMQAQFSTEWRSEMTGDLVRRHESSIANYEQERPSATYYFKFIRGRNRIEDSPYYDQGTATVEDVMMHLSARYAEPRRTVTVTGPFKLLTYDCGLVFPLTSAEGIGANGWTNRGLRITHHTVYLSKGQVTLECYDLRKVIETREELTTADGLSPGASPEYSPPQIGNPFSPSPGSP